MAASSKSAVFMAVLANFGLTIVKFIAFLLSGSGSMFSEAVHSGADAANQALLYLGIRSSERPADAMFHYGYGGDRYLLALLSAVGIFVFGAGVTIYHGVHTLLDPVEVESSWLSYVVLAISFVVDGAVLITALRAVYAQKGDKSLMQFLRTTSDPTIAAVLFEDTVATAGVVIAGIAIMLTEVTGNPLYDALGAIFVGFMLGLIAIWLGLKNRKLLLGPAIPKHIFDGVMELLQQNPAVKQVRSPKSRVVGAGQYRFAAEIDFDGAYLGRKHAALVAERAALLGDPAEQERLAADFGDRMVDAVAAEIDQIELELRKRFPELVHLEFEAD